MMKFLENLSRFFTKTFALWVIIFAILGFIFPEIFKQIGPWIPYLLGVIMFGMGLTLSPADFREVFRRPFDVFVGIVGQYTIMPFGAYLVCKLFNLPPEIAVGLLLLGCCPGGTASNVVTFLARGDVALSVTITSCTTLLAPVMTPALMYLLASTWLEINPMAMLMSIVKIVLVPIVAGVLINRLFHRQVEKAVVMLPALSTLTIMLIAASIVSATKSQLLAAGFMAFAAVAAHNALGMFAGYVLARLCGMNYAKAKCLTFEVGMQNSGLGVALSGLHFAAAPMTALPSAIGALWHNITGPLIATYFASRDEKMQAKEATRLAKPATAKA
ncbi:MAG: bile acid:sodium symporter family protein [Sutterella sp.]|nr:bile acid:sodium symporter family protein [Sutterella sp.]